ncbi:MAG: PD-(D/E)XK nuclease family protein [Shewanella sp.]
MIKLTNNYNIPLPLVMWLLNDDYDYNPDPKTFSATSLIKPTKKTKLSSAVARSPVIHYPIDVSTKLASIRGQNIHAAIEAACQDTDKMHSVAAQLGMFVPEMSVEKRLTAEIEVDGVMYTISGKYDITLNGEVSDWKTENTYSFGDKVKEHERVIQLSIYKWLRKKHNLPTSNKGTYYSIYQNWMQGFKDKIKDDTKYPSAPILGFQVDLLHDAQIEFWMKDRIREHRDLTIEEVDSIECTRGELWMDTPVYQFFSKPDAARASKNFDSHNEALAYAATKQGGVVKEKPQFAKACEYCVGSPICSQYTRLESRGLIRNASNAISISQSFGEDC